MNFSASTLSFDEFLQDRPTHDELCNHIVFCDWRLLAICLPTITDIDVDVIFEETGGISSLALQQTFQLWLKKCPNASRQQVIQILKSRVIGQNAIAAKYESALKELYGEFLKFQYVVYCLYALAKVFIFSFDFWKDNSKLPCHSMSWIVLINLNIEFVFLG